MTELHNLLENHINLMLAFREDQEMFVRKYKMAFDINRELAARNNPKLREALNFDNFPKSSIQKYFEFR